MSYNDNKRFKQEYRSQEAVKICVCMFLWPAFLLILTDFLLTIAICMEVDMMMPVHRKIDCPMRGLKEVEAVTYITKVHTSDPIIS